MAINHEEVNLKYSTALLDEYSDSDVPSSFGNLAQINLAIVLYVSTGGGPILVAGPLINSRPT